MASENEILTEIRINRHGLLIDNVDKPIRNYLHSGQTIPQSLKDYRSNLLDITKDISGVDLDVNGKLTGLTWPTKPE